MKNDRFPAAIRPRPVVLGAMILSAALLRLAPHPPNFTPVGAMALFAGASFMSRRAALAVPLLAMAVSDVVMEMWRGNGFHLLMPVVYACMALTTWFGMTLRGRARPTTVFGIAVASAVLFYVVTNLAVWVSGGGYPMTVSGLLTCYVAAVPFFGNTLAGHVLYSALLFGAFALAERRFPALTVSLPART